MDGVSSQEVFNLGLADEVGLLETLPVVGQVRCQVNGNIFLQQAVCDIGFLEHIGLDRRYDEGLHVVFADMLHQVLIVHIYVDAHHHLSLHGGIVCHKTLQVEFVGTGQADGLGNVDTTAPRTVDEGVIGVADVFVKGIVHGLDGHPGEGHAHEHYHIGNGEHGQFHQFVAETIV